MKYTPVDLIHVRLDIEGESIPVGRLAMRQGQIWFEYDRAIIDRKLEISPFMLPLKTGAVSGKESPFEGLFGVFNDSLPDGWGRLLLDRAARAHGIAHQSLTPLDRLAHVGNYGMGALVYEPDYTDAPKAPDGLNLDKLAQETQLVLEGEAIDVLEELYALNGSSAGARPKILAGYNEKTGKIIHGQQILPVGYEHWVIKFSSSGDPVDIAAIEYAYSLMAKAAGVNMPETKLFESKKGLYFGTKRFDRTGKGRVHMHTACGLLHADHRVPSLDYENLLRATVSLCKDMQQTQELFRLAAFNVLAHNRDDHSKNFSFLMNKEGKWHVAPAYDLTFSYGPGREHSMMVMGEGKSPSKQHLLQLGDKLTLGKTKKTIEEVQAAVKNWKKFADKAGVTKTSYKIVQEALDKIA
jgi:serine/threonine-protein kinase HipA